MLAAEEKNSSAEAVYVVNHFDSWVSGSLADSDYNANKRIRGKGCYSTDDVGETKPRQ